MALPLDPTSPSAASSPGLGDDEIRALKQFLVDICGFPVNPNAVANSGFLFSTAGLTKVILQNLGSDPTGAGEIARNGSRLRFHDGANVQELGYRSDQGIFRDASQPAIVNNSTEQSFYAETIQGATLFNDSTAYFIHVRVVFVVTSMLSGSTLQFRFSYGGQLFFAPVLTNGTGGLVTSAIVSAELRLHAANSAVAQVAWGEITVAPIHADLNFGSSLIFRTESALALSVNSNVAHAFQVNGLWSVADAANSVSGLGIDGMKV